MQFFASQYILQGCCI